MKKLIFFSLSYPFSNDYSWKRNELEKLVDHFDITLVPFLFNKAKLTSVPNGIEILSPFLQQIDVIKPSYFFKVLFKKHAAFYFRELIRKRTFRNKIWFLEWLAAVDRISKMLKDPFVRDLMRFRKENENTILYFYWGVGSTLLIPFLARYNYHKIVVRFHGFDLYEERKTGYIPFRTDLLKSLDHAIYISEDGLKYARSKYGHVNFQSHVFKLGSKSANPPKPDHHQSFRIVSCSNVIPLKRVELIAQALKLIPFKVEWLHMGDGETFEDLKKICQELPAHIMVQLPGRFTPEKVLEVYSEKSFDLFINVSTSEGLPVSIMEALSAGIPVLATQVGGTAEIVNEFNGKLVDPDLNPAKLAEIISEFRALDAGQLAAYRKAARETYEDKCDFDKLTQNFIRFLES
ncbi:MAG: glycosyltransferase [Bacteroidetes bacterium]|nr:glycosyltransferase [Bacteroidota bacterium]